ALWRLRHGTCLSSAVLTATTLHYSPKSRSLGICQGWRAMAWILMHSPPTCLQSRPMTLVVSTTLRCYPMRRSLGIFPGRKAMAWMRLST
ncbi:hypothetical protein H4S07_006682, partial [Coemansia furcata]